MRQQQLLTKLETRDRKCMSEVSLGESDPWIFTNEQVVMVEQVGRLSTG